MHLTLDALTPAPATREQVERWLLETPASIGMTIIRDEAGNPRMAVLEHEGRLHGIITIAESHLAAHVDGLVLSLDVFSCTSFDATWVVQDAQARFGFEGYRYNLDMGRLNLETM